VRRRVITLISLSMAIILFGSMAYAAVITKDMRRKLENIRLASTVYDRNGKVIGNLYFSKRIWTPLNKMPANLKNAVIAIEDSRFYQHNGIDPKGMARAFFRNLQPGGNKEGGSTITQQLAKIVLLSSERTISRKLKDISYAMEIERVYSKDEILELYLNSVYLAHGNVGMEAASRYYFGKSVDKLSLDQAALLAGLIQSPENYSPVKHPKEALTRRNVVLKRMFELKYITNAQYQAALKKPVKVVKTADKAPVAGYFLDYVREYLLQEVGMTEEQLRFGGYKIYTSLDLNMQRQAEQTMAKLPVVSNAKTQPQGALVTLDPNNGQVLAMVGGRSYSESQYNRAVKSHRQPGSTIKPFIYATALEKGYTAATIMEDRALSIPLANGGIWEPKNYDGEYLGPVSLRVALRKSINTIAVQLLQEIGIEPVVEQMEKMGITSLVKTGVNNDLNLAPLSLGGLTKGVTPLELAAAYAPFANLGRSVKPYAVLKITDKNGKLVRRFTPVRQRALSEQTAYIMTSLMQDVMEQGTGWRARLPGRPAAGKTGTSSDYTNAWFAGYTPDLLTVVWIGNDRQDQSMRYKNLTIGSGTAAGLWKEYMTGITKGRPVRDFREPPGIIWADVNPATGEVVPGWLARDTYKEVFNENNVPASRSYKIWRWFFPGRKRGAQEDDAAGMPDQAGPEEAPEDNWL